MRWKLIVGGALLALGLSATPAAAQWGYGSGVYTDGTRTRQANPYAQRVGMYTANLSYGYGQLPWYSGYRDYGLSYGPQYFGGYGYSSSGLSNNGNAYYNYPGLGTGSGWYGLPSAAACCRGLGPFVGPLYGYGIEPRPAGGPGSAAYPSGGLSPVAPVGTYDQLCTRDGQWVC